MELVTITNGVLTLLVIGLTQVLKRFVPDRFVTLLPLALGVIGTGITAGWTGAAIVTGLIIGLSAQGLYDHKEIVA